MIFCIRFGIFSLRNTLRSRSAKANGNIDEARIKATKSKKLGIAAIIVEIVLGAFGVLLRKNKRKRLNSIQRNLN